MNEFLSLWTKSAQTSLGLFWMAFWAFGLGYVVSSMIQVFVTEEKMKETMGEAGVKSVSLGTFFGFISSSCSFAALSTTRAIFAKGAGLIPSLAFLLASTNLVIELGIVISIFLSWQFVVGEYLGAIVLILLMALIVKLTLPKDLEKDARQSAQKKGGPDKDQEKHNWKKQIQRKEGWHKVATQYFMEWQMVWKDVTIGFAVAGAIAAFVPQSFFETLFVGSSSTDPVFYQILLQTIVGPVVAFFTFIGSMGNIPLAAVLFGNGVSFAGIMAFIFSDLIVFPVLRIQAKYYGWKMALYIMAVFLIILIGTSLAMHYGFAILNLLPDATSAKTVANREFFKVDYTLYLNAVFLLISVFAFAGHFKTKNNTDNKDATLTNKVLFWLAMLSYLWLVGGLVVKLFV